MNKKTIKIIYCMSKIQDILDYLRPGNNWELAYDIPEHVVLSDWDKERLGLIDGEDYFFIFIENKVMYAINVTGDSVLTAIEELVHKLAQKF